MKFGIGAKLGLLASALIIATVLTLAWLMMSWSKDALTRQELAALGDETRLRGEELLHGLQNLREDALRQAGRAALRDFLQAMPNPPVSLQEKIRKDFRDLLASSTAYLQVEYLPPDNRAGAAILAVARPDQDVHISKAQLKYFPGLAETRDNAVWLSAARRTADARIGGQEVPVLRAAAPLFASDAYAGAVVITADFRQLAKGLRRSARHLVYLTDEQGRFLAHPDPGQAFAFEQGDAPHIYDDLLPELKQFYTAGDGASVRLTRWRGHRYPGSDKDGVALGRYYLLRLEAVRPEDWKQQKDVHEQLEGYLEELPVKGGVAGSRADDPTHVAILRGRDEGRLQDTARDIVERFRPHLQVGKQIACDHYAVHFYRLTYTPRGSPPHWFGLAQGVAREEIVAGVNDKTAGVIWIKLALIAGGVAVAFLLSRRLTRPLQRITEATRDLAQGEADVDLDLPVNASDEIGVLARCFKDMVDQLRQRGQQLREGEARLRVILKTAAEGIFILDDDGTIQMVNQAAEHLFGYVADELKGQNVKLLLPKEVQGLPRTDGGEPAAEAGISSIRLGRVNNRTQEAVGRRKDGSLFTLELSVSDVPLGERRLYTGIVRDITERKRAEAEIRELNQHLRELNDQLDRRVRERTRQLERTNDELSVARDQALEASRAKSQFLAQMSHELRTPLNAIKGYSELLLEEAEERELYDFVPDLNKIIEAGKHLLALINDVLDLSKIEAHKVELFLETFDVEALVQAVVSTVGPAAKKNGNELVVRCQGAGSMFADRTRVRQVLLNLLSNACKFTHEGRVEMEVVREPCHGRDGLAFRVRDTGIGIKPEQLAKLFKPFSQVDDATTRKHDGTGLGLAISRSFCQMMGGDISVTSEPGKGSVFTAHLPVQVTDAAESQVVAAGGPAVGAGTVLVVDDDPAVRDLMQRYLDKEGFRAVTAANGREGLRLARQLRPRAITLDVLMPGMDGWDVLSALKADPGTASIPVIMLTIADDRGLGRALGADEYMTKPIDRDRLTEVLKRYQSDTTASRER